MVFIKCDFDTILAYFEERMSFLSSSDFVAFATVPAAFATVLAITFTVAVTLDFSSS